MRTFRRQSSDEDVQDFFERVSTCVMLSFKKSIINMKKEFVAGHVAALKRQQSLCVSRSLKGYLSGVFVPRFANKWNPISHLAKTIRNY